ncbi:MAG: DUF1080 domain-containing protein [Chitinophagaceae bacterium]|nr:DUF1080 domain-containing protein [Chitinophagaceae bacterium]
MIFKYSFLVVVVSFYIISCKKADKKQNMGEQIDTINVLTAEEQKKGWKLLFDGNTFAGWHNYGMNGVVGWKIENGEIIALGESNDIVTDQDFENFELALEWKISKGGNSGIFFHVKEDFEQYKRTFQTGPEYQLIDQENHINSLDENQKTAANYGMHTAQNPKYRPYGEWNTTRIIVKQGNVEHWLNGEKVLEYTLQTKEWLDLKNTGKWKAFPDYGKFTTGKIALQDHGSPVFFRKIKLLPL